MWLVQNKGKNRNPLSPGRDINSIRFLRNLTIFKTTIDRELAIHRSKESKCKNYQENLKRSCIWITTRVSKRKSHAADCVGRSQLIAATKESLWGKSVYNKKTYCLRGRFKTIKPHSGQKQREQLPSLKKLANHTENSVIKSSTNGLFHPAISVYKRIVIHFRRPKREKL